MRGVFFAIIALSVGLIASCSDRPNPGVVLGNPSIPTITTLMARSVEIVPANGTEIYLATIESDKVGVISRIGPYTSALSLNKRKAMSKNLSKGVNRVVETISVTPDIRGNVATLAGTFANGTEITIELTIDDAGELASVALRINGQAVESAFTELANPNLSGKIIRIATQDKDAWEVALTDSQAEVYHFQPNAISDSAVTTYSQTPVSATMQAALPASGEVSITLTTMSSGEIVAVALERNKAAAAITRFGEVAAKNSCQRSGMADDAIRIAAGLCSRLLACHPFIYCSDCFAGVLPTVLMDTKNGMMSIQQISDAISSKALSADPAALDSCLGDISQADCSAVIAFPQSRMGYDPANPGDYSNVGLFLRYPGNTCRMVF